jgi:hypothetical protein
MNDPAPITATVGTTDQTDLVMPNGAAVVTTVSGGTPSQPPAAAYQFSWSNDETGQFIAGLVAGEYTVTVTDLNGCTASVTVVVDLMVGTGELVGVGTALVPQPCHGLGSGGTARAPRTWEPAGGAVRCSGPGLDTRTGPRRFL